MKNVVDNMLLTCYIIGSYTKQLHKAVKTF
nr:MAG TPA: hypothetical protein [Caudoviricetes sp.]